MQTIQRKVVGAVLLSKDGKVLLGRSAPEAKGVFSGQWCVPGGGIEARETSKEALIREIYEETHHDISQCQIELVLAENAFSSPKKLKDTGQIVLVEMVSQDYLVKLQQTARQLGTKPSAELAELKWFDVKSLKTAPVAPPTKKLLKILGLMD